MSFEIKSVTDAVLFVSSCLNLRDAILEAVSKRANLSGANLSGANLYGANLPEGFRVGRLDFGGWSVLVTEKITTIGCQSCANKVWLKHTPKSVSFMHPDASKWWKQHGSTVKALIRDVSRKGKS